MSSLLLYAYVLAKTACGSKSREGFATPWPQTRSGSMHFPTMLTHAAGLPLGQIVGWLLNTGGPESKPAERVEHKVNTKCAKMTLVALLVLVGSIVFPRPKIGQGVQAMLAKSCGGKGSVCFHFGFVYHIGFLQAHWPRMPTSRTLHIVQLSSVTGMPPRGEPQACIKQLLTG